MEAYLDNSATTCVYQETADLVCDLMVNHYGNPSAMHQKGVEAEQYIRTAQETLAKILKVKEKEIFFTSGGTESDNWALVEVIAELCADLCIYCCGAVIEHEHGGRCGVLAV